jgi:hypothetical protein
MERNRRGFVEARNEDVSQLWDRIHFWVSVSSEFKDYSSSLFFMIGIQL